MKGLIIVMLYGKISLINVFKSLLEEYYIFGRFYFVEGGLIDCCYLIFVVVGFSRYVNEVLCNVLMFERKD